MTKKQLPPIPWDRIYAAAKAGNPIAQEIITMWDELSARIRKYHEERLKQLIRSEKNWLVRFSEHK